MSKIDLLFAQLKAQQKKAFMPFLTAGDPSLNFTSRLITAFDKWGCDLCEVGIPYSDPIADGPVIQASYTRALNQGVNVDAILATLKTTNREISMPTVTMVSYSIVYRIGLETYIDRAIDSGISGMIIPDLPVDEAEDVSRICTAKDFSLIQLVTPTTNNERARRILETSSGFIYYVSVTGITGERRELPPEIVDRVSWLRENGDLPVCIGFGISEPDHVRQLAPHSDGLIVGSAIVRRIAATQESEDQIIESVGHYVQDMLNACKQ